jgi:hypothetical protein
MLECAKVLRKLNSSSKLRHSAFISLVLYLFHVMPLELKLTLMPSCCVALGFRVPVASILCQVAVQLPE